jgi:hypothetical protein
MTWGMDHAVEGLPGKLGTLNLNPEPQGKKKYMC